MAIYHLHMSTVSRSSGRSAVAAAAYRAGVQLTDARTGMMYDYSPRRRSGGILESYIIIPDGAPEWALDRQALWDRAEASESRTNSVTAREVEVALPAELTEAEGSDLARQIGTYASRRFSAAVDVARHSPNKKGDQRNRHVHFLMTTRELDGDGFGKKTRELDDRRSGAIAEFREECARLTNEALARAGSTARVDHRSYETQGIDRVPGIHLGAASGMERRDPTRRTPRGDRNRERAAANAAKEAAAVQVVRVEQMERKASSEERMGRARLALGLPDPVRAREASRSSRPSRDSRLKGAGQDDTRARIQRHRPRTTTAVQDGEEARTPAMMAPAHRATPSQHDNDIRIIATSAGKDVVVGPGLAAPLPAPSQDAEQARMAQTVAVAGTRRARAPTTAEIRAVIRSVLRVPEGGAEARFVHRDGDKDGPVAGVQRVLDARHMPHRTEPSAIAGSRTLIVAIDSLVELARQFVAAAKHDVVEARLQLGRLARRLWRARIASAHLVREAAIRAAKPQQDPTARRRVPGTPATSAGWSGLKQPRSMDVRGPSIPSAPATPPRPDHATAVDRGRASDVPPERKARPLPPATPGSSRDARARALVPSAGTSPDTARSDQMMAEEARRPAMEAAGARRSSRDDQARQLPQISTQREPPGGNGGAGLIPPSTGGHHEPAAPPQAEPVPSKSAQPSPQPPAVVVEQLGLAGEDAVRWAASWTRAVVSGNKAARSAIVTVWMKAAHRDQAQLAAIKQSMRVIAEWARADRPATVSWADAVDRLPPKTIAAVEQQMRQAGRGAGRGR